MNAAITRPDGSTVEFELVTQGNVHKSTKVTQISEPIVDERGNVQAVIVQPRLRDAGLALVVQHEGQLVLTKHAREAGYVFYRDMCLGRVDGVEASPVHWRIYEKVREIRIAGGRIADYPPEKIYHPEVIRRRVKYASGHAIVDAAEMDKIIGEIREAHAGEDAELVAKRAKEIGMVLPEKDDDLASLVEQAEGKKGRRHAN